MSAADAPRFPTLYCTTTGSAEQSLQSCSSEGLVGAGYLQRVLSCCDPNPSWFDKEWVELCGHVFVTCTVFTRGNRTALLLLQQRLHELLNGMEAGLGKDALQPVVSQCVEFLHFIEVFVHRYQNSKGFGSVAMDIVTHLPLLGDVIDPFDEQLSMLSAAVGGRNHQATANQIFHLALRLRFASLCVLHRLAVCSPSSLEPHQRSELSATSNAALARLAGSIAQWLLNQALLTFRKSASGVRERLRGCGLFPCSCVVELWLAVLHIGSGGRGFWGHVTSILQEKLEGSVDAEVLSFSWWVLTQLAGLHLFSTSGELGGNKPPLPGCWETVVAWLPQSLAVPECIAGCVWSCWALARWWGQSLDVISRLWEHYHRHMNESGGVAAGGSLSHWTSTESTSPQRWLQYTLEFGRGVHGYEAPPTHLDRSGYELFLSLLSEGLHCSGGGDDQTLAWRKVKGRFYSKIHRRWIRNLSVSGMRRLVSLFLVLAESADTLEVGGKMLANLSNGGSSRWSLSEVKEGSSTLWKGVFALLLLCEEKGCHMTSLVEKLLPPVNTLMKGAITGSCDHRLLWDTVGVVLDGMQELLESSRAVELGACKLLDGYLTEMLGKLVGGDLSRVLRLVESLATSLSLHLTTSSAAADPARREAARGGCQQLWTVCGPAVIARAKDTAVPASSSSSSSQLALTAAALTVLTCNWQRSLSDTLLQEFAFATSTRPELAGSYLCYVISDDALKQDLFASERTQLRVVNVWLRCVLALPTTGSRQLEELTGFVQRLPLLSSLWETPPSADVFVYFEQLLRSINSKHLNAGGSSVWRGHLQLVLGNFLSFVEPSLSPRGGGGAAMRSCYKAASAIMRSCPRMVYSKMDSRCLLPLLVDRLVLPLATSKAPLSQSQASCIRNHLHHVVSGLLQLEPEGDSFIKRKLKQIFSRYFHRYASSQQGAQATLVHTGPNPFLLLLQPAFQTPPLSSSTRVSFQFCLDVVTSQFLVLPQEPAALLPTLQYLATVLERVKCHQLLADCTPLLLRNMLLCLLACDVCAAHTEPRGIRAKVTGILKSLLSSSDHLTPVVLATIKHYVSSNLHRSQGATLKPLHVLAALNKPLVQAAMEDIKEAVEGEGTSIVKTAFSQLEGLVRMNYHDDADALL